VLARRKIAPREALYMQYSQLLLDDAKQYGIDIANALNTDSPRDALRRSWNAFIDKHPPQIQIILREQFYNGYYATRNFAKENG
jgi:hypothetical protein